MSNTATAQQVQQAYLAYFSRPADPSGLNYWMTQSVSAMDAGFASSAEFNNFYMGLDANQQVEQIYQNILGRQSDVGGLYYWAAQLQTGVPISVLVNSILNTVLNNEGNTGVDYTTVTGRLGYSAQFTANATTSGYAGTAAASLARTDLDQIQSNISTAQLATIMSSISADISGVSAASAPMVGTVDVLTANPTSTTANAFSASLDNTAGTPLSSATLTGSDTLTGAATGASANNVLTITDSSPTGADLLPAGLTLHNIQTIIVNTAGHVGNAGAGVLGGVSVGDAFDVSGITGLVSLTVNSSSNNSNMSNIMNASSTTNVTVVSQNNTGGVFVAGGHNVTIDSTSNTIQVGGGGGGSYPNEPSGVITINNTSNSSFGAVFVDGGTSVVVNENGASGIRLFNITGDVTINDVGFNDGATSLGLISVDDTANPIQGAININCTTDGGAGYTPSAGQVSIVADGGTSVNIVVNYVASAAEMQAINNSTFSGVAEITGSEIEVNGSANTTTVSVTQTAATGVVAPGTLGIADGSVVITDLNSAITSVTLNNYSDSTFGNTGGGDALTSISLNGTAGTLLIAEANATNPSLNLSVNDLSVVAGTAGDAITIMDTSNKIATLNIATGVNASTLTAIYSVSTAQAVALHTLNVSGSSMLTVSGLLPASLTTLTVSGASAFDGSVAGTSINSISVGADAGTGGAQPTSPNLILAGVVTGDNILFTNEAGTQSISVASSAIAPGASVQATIALLEAAANATLHNVVYATFGNNTYAVEAAATNSFTVIELVGSHTVTGSTGHVVVAS